MHHAVVYRLVSTPRRLAAALASRGAPEAMTEGDGGAAAFVASRAPASFSQASLWFQQQARPLDWSYNIAFAVDGRGVGPNEVRSAWREVGARQPALRTRFTLHDGRLLQIVDPAIPDLEETRDLAMIDAEARRPFPPDGALVRGVLARLPDGSFRLGVVVHHAVFDDRSIALWLADFAAALGGRPGDGMVTGALSLGARQRRSFATPAHAALLERYRQSLDGAPHIVDLLTDMPRAPVPGHAGATLSAALPAEDRAALARLCQHRGATLFCGLLAAFAVMISRLSGQSDLLIGCPFDIRDAEDLGAVGNFTNLLPLRVQPRPGLSFAALIDQVQAGTLSALEARSVPFPSLVQAVHVESGPGRHPLVQIMFNYLRRDLGDRVWRDGAPPLRCGEIMSDSAKFDMTLEVLDEPCGTLVRLNYAAALFQPDTASAMLRRYLGIVSEAAVRPETPVERLSLLLPVEERKILGFNPPAAPRPRLPVQEAIAARCQGAPERLAVLAEDGNCTFGELWPCVADLASRLRAAGIGPGTPVGLFFAPSLALITALLAVARARHRTWRDRGAWMATKSPIVSRLVV